jgi:ankyrin repeat protein
MVRFLLDSGATVDASDEAGTTPLHLAARVGKDAVVALLLDRGASIEERDLSNGTALMLACLGGHASTAQLLIARGAPVEAANHAGLTALHIAARGGAERLLKVLLEAGANVDVTSKAGRAARDLLPEGASQGARALLEPRRKVRKAGGVPSTSPLHRAVSGGDFSKVRELLEGDADIDARDGENRTPLHLAAQAGNTRLTAFLLSRGAMIEAQGENGSRPLHLACLGGHAPIVGILIEKGAAVDATNKDHRTPLHVAAGRGDASIVRLLVDAGADTTRKDADGRTPLECVPEAVRERLGRTLGGGSGTPKRALPPASPQEAMQIEARAVGECAPEGTGKHAYVGGKGGLAYYRFEGIGAKDARNCLERKRGWKEVGPPDYPEGAMLSPRWHNDPLPETMGEADRIYAYRMRGDVEALLGALVPLAEAGDRVAQFRLGGLHMEGLGMPRDYRKARFWLRKAADQGEARAADHLAHMCLLAKGARRDEGEAESWFRRAAEGGDHLAQIKYAAILLTRAAEKPDDGIRAQMWLSIAASQHEHHKYLPVVRKRLDKILTPLQRRTGDRLAERWRKDHPVQEDLCVIANPW